MQFHTKTYYDHFGLDICDTPECEVNGDMAADIHHIYGRQMGSRKYFTHDGITYHINAIENLIALNREEHAKAESRTKDKDYYWNIHQQTLNDYA